MSKQHKIIAILIALAVGPLLTWRGWHEFQISRNLEAVGEMAEIKFGMLVAGIAVLVGGSLLAVFFKKPLSEQEAAEEVAKQLAPLCQTRHEYVTVQAREFTHLDLNYYDEGRRRLEAFGFVFLTDQEDLTIGRTSKSGRVLLRALVRRENGTMACLYHFKPGWMIRALGVKEFKVVDFETQFTNGTFVCTTNAETAGKLDSPPVVDALYLPAATSIESVLQSHEERMARHLARNPGVQAVCVSTLEEIRRAQDELQRVRAKHRQQTGLSRQELERLAGPDNCVNIATLHAEVQKQHEQQLRKAA